MADDWAEFNPQPAPQPAAPAADPWAEFSPQAAPKPAERSVLQRAGEAAADTFMSGARSWLPDEGERNPLTALAKTHQRVMSPFTMTVGPVISAGGSLIASGVSEAARRITGGDEKRSEEMYEKALPMGEAALGAVGRVPGVAGAGKFPMPDTILPKTKKVPAKGPEAEAGRYLEEHATDPEAVRRQLANPDKQIIPGHEPTTYQYTGDIGLGQEERGAARRPGEVERFLERKGTQTAARHQALEDIQPTGTPAEVSAHLRRVMEEENAAADRAFQAAKELGEREVLEAQQRGAQGVEAAQQRGQQGVELAQQRGTQAVEELGGTYDPTTYGNIMRRQLQDAEEVTRAFERSRWERIDPNLPANPQPLQEVERSIYGVMREGGAEEASLSPAERTVSRVIQEMPPQGVPFNELRTLRSLISGELRKELATNGSTPAYARLSRLRQGIEGAIADSVAPEVYAQVREATAATAQRAETFRAPGVKEATRREGVQGPYRVGEAMVPEQFVRSGPGGYDRASNYLRAVGEPGLPEFTDAVAAKARRTVINPDGTVNPTKLQTFLRQHRETLRAIDERDGGAFSARLSNLGTAQEAIEAAQTGSVAGVKAAEASRKAGVGAAEANQAAIARRQGADQLKAMIGATDDTTVQRVIGGIFGRQDAVPRVQELMRRLAGNDAAIQGARAAVVGHVRDTLTSNALVGAGPALEGEALALRAEQFQKWVMRNRAALGVILDPVQVEALEKIALSLRQAARSANTKAIGGGSDTVQNWAKAAKQEESFGKAALKHYGTFLGRIVMHFVGAHFGFAGSAAAVGAESMVMGARARRAAAQAKHLESVQQLVDDALLNPEKAAELLGKTHTYRDKTPGAKRGAAYGLGAESARERRFTREAGGGVPALGGTGGRSPGTTTPAGPRAARQGTGQALADGGAAGEQQAAPLSGSRERLAAALAASPAGGEFSSKIAGKTGAEKKKPSPLGREDIVKQLQGRGLSTEGWGAPSGFGESRVPSVDSRADGGEVEDRWAALPKSRNIEDRRSEDISIGQLIAGNQAMMGRYPSPYTRAPRTSVSAQARADGGEVDEPPLPDPLLEAEGARTAAAMRLAGSARPSGGRKEGATTQFLEKGLPILTRAAADKPEHYLEAAKGLAGRIASIPERMWKGSEQLRSGETDPETGEQRFDPSGPGDVALFGAGARMPVKAAPNEFVLGAGRVRRTGGGRRPPREPPSDEPPPPMGHNMPPEELPVERRRTSSLGLRDMPIGQAIKQAQTEAHIIPSNPKVREGYVGAPDWVKTPEDLAKMRADLDAQIESGMGGAKWYREAQAGIKEMAGPDPTKQHQLAQQKAVTSAQATPETNLGFALQGHNAILTGKPLDIVRTGDIAERMTEGAKTGEIGLGPKTGIYARHMDPTMEDPSVGTNDIWHARAFGYENPEGGLKAHQHAFMDAETVLAVHRANERKLGGRSDWTPGEIQAAPWVFNKAQGLQEQFGWPPDKAMAEAVKTYNSYFDKHTAFGTHEATPGVGTRHLPGIAQGTQAEREAFAADPRSSWRDPSGRDVMYQSLGMYVRPSVKATGVFEGPEGLEINPAEVARPMVGFEGGAGKRQVDPASRRLMDAAEAARAYMDVQNAGAWSIPIEKQQVGQSTSVYARRPGGGPLPIEDIKKLQEIGGRHGLPGVIDYGEGTALTSFGGGPTGRQLGKSTLPQEVEAAIGVRPGQVKLDTGYIDYQSLWGGKQGTGSVTRALQEHLLSKDAPAILKRLDASPELRQAVAARLERDAEIARQTGQPIRRDVQRARTIFIKSGFEGLFRALAKGAALPAAAFAPLAEALQRREAPVE